MRLFIIYFLMLSALAPFTYAQNRLPAGVTYELNGQNLSIVMDQKKLLQLVPKLQKAGSIDRMLTRTEMSFYQPLLAATVSLSYVTSIVKNIYLTQSNIDQLHVSTFLLATDLYGNFNKNPCYSFDFNRKLYQRINWSKFQSENMKAIAPNFKTAGLCRELRYVEPSSI